MIQIKHTDILGAVRLSPMDMNHIHFDTGRHTPIAGNTDSVVPPK